MSIFQKRSIYPYSNQWSTDKTNIHQFGHSSTVCIDDDRSSRDDNRTRGDLFICMQFCSWFFSSTFLQGFLLGILTGSILLATIISLWLTSSVTTMTLNMSNIVSTTSSITTSSTSMPTSSGTTTTTSAFNCASTITSTLKSYTETNCPKNIWHTFPNSFIASYTGIQTLVFSFNDIKHAIMYLTNIRVHDTSNVQLLTNGNFSSSSGITPTNWLKCSDNGQVDATCDVNPTIACYTISTDGGTILQSFSVVFGVNYTIEFDLYHISTSGNSDSITLDVSII
ncbi:hypothetical protein I4U23_004069 [Adineta vaga]|nr:hypothetical protein I4U23_004069 [Adineta vaga]